jgi:hypothetical protein
MLILAFALCAGLGYLAISSVWPEKKPTFAASMIRLSLTPGFGLGVFSVVFWLTRVFGSAHVLAADLSLLVLLGLTYSFRYSRAAKATTYSSSSRAKSRDFAFASKSPNHSLPDVLTRAADFHAPKWVARTVTASFAVALLAALYYAVLRVLIHPHGDGWDAFAIWNLHARFLFLGGAHWRDGFNSLIPWSHPDYPLLLPATIAHLWSYLGHDDPLVSAIVGLIVTFSTLALLVSSLASLRGRNTAMLGGLALSSTPFFLEQGTSQYADVPLSFFILASITLLHIAEGQNRNSQSVAPMILAGLAAGFAAWTKNEGLLFLCALILAQVWACARRPGQVSGAESGGNWRPVVYFVLGAVPLLVLIFGFKYSIAATGDLFSSPSTMIHKILTPRRYWIILQWFAKEFLRFGDWWIVPGTAAMLAIYLLTFQRRKAENSSALQQSTLTLFLTLAGYFAIYLITPRDLYWHLRFSLNRLFLQLWPSAIFLFFLYIGPQMWPRSLVSSAVAQRTQL